MSSTSETAKPATVTPLPDLKLLAGALGNPTRWRMLKELSLGEPRTVGELATAAGCIYDNAGRHLAVLRKAGLVAQGRGRLYQILNQYLPAPGERTVDFGHCLLRLDAAG
ncbi:MAG TPA: helix-turn-helix domain-containing protein [Verrucomicrobiae bacterium]